jgi:hypothetical protein
MNKLSIAAAMIALFGLVPGAFAATGASAGANVGLPSIVLAANGRHDHRFDGRHGDGRFHHGHNGWGRHNAAYRRHHGWYDRHHRWHPHKHWRRHDHRWCR